jgi:hypothetical protein
MTEPKPITSPIHVHCDLRNFSAVCRTEMLKQSPSRRKPARECVIQVRLTSDELQTIAGNAISEGMDLSKFVRSRCLPK